MERLKNHREFVAVLRKRRKFSGRDIVAHYRVHDAEDSQGATGSTAGIGSNQSDSGSGATRSTSSHASKRLGLAVSKAVGNAVTRNAVKRRFRVAARRHQDLLPEGCDVVLRAKPSASHASYAELDDQVRRTFARIGGSVGEGR